MSYKIGKVKNYNGYTGEIVTEKQNYYFIKNDIVNNEKLSDNDFVKFKSKTEDAFPQGYYVKKLNLKIVNKNQG